MKNSEKQTYLEINRQFLIDTINQNNFTTFDVIEKAIEHYYIGIPLKENSNYDANFREEFEFTVLKAKFNSPNYGVILSEMLSYAYSTQIEEKVCHIKKFVYAYLDMKKEITDEIDGLWSSEWECTFAEYTLHTADSLYGDTNVSYDWEFEKPIKKTRNKK